MSDRSALRTTCDSWLAKTWLSYTHDHLVYRPQTTATESVVGAFTMYMPCSPIKRSADPGAGRPANSQSCTGTMLVSTGPIERFSWLRVCISRRSPRHQLHSSDHHGKRLGNRSHPHLISTLRPSLPVCDPCQRTPAGTVLFSNTRPP
jgi:hypothetical protein